ncbi:ubiquinol-cytochrome c reductase cytochrome b subunit [Auritidibacter sp. NML130574]|uniref:cytochrome bc1 complex cytochrome b subunit n=1 Tax=Auritidibacter sp. NML130574 TaxID=2170745 RepID=UPI000D737DBC|nr:ubiquinol-cytochrome c reductase cytochrome b subunit [Auritidibacter sp. NML130574]AXR73564.1 ubiquinol-cytochrome c reductase cytochrome b subunit [Auritidibacter sp. NML130574]
MTTVHDYNASTRTGKIANFVDTRVGASKIIKEFGRKLFPDHWTFLFGEVALYSFVILVLSGAFLTFFFDPSMSHVTYEGSYKPLYGVEMSAAYASALDISFDIRGGLFMRQLHHWAALLFMASLSFHMLRVFFTGAFRRPRELNWVVGCTLLVLGILAGFTGYSLPDDVLSGNGLRIVDGMIKAVPIVGTYISMFLFGGEFPGEDIISRLYSLHIMVIPGLLILLIAIHLFMVVTHKHTQYPGPGRTEQNVVGYPIGPVYAAKAGGFFFIVFGILALIAGLFQMNAIWNYGPYDPSPVSAGTQPDWYVGFGDGALRLMPGMLGDYSFLWHIPTPWGENALPMGVLTPLIPMALLILGMFVWPWIERWITKDNREHHVLDRPRNAPGRTGVGVAGVIFYCVMWAAASSDLIATHFHVSLNDVTYVLRVLYFLGPILGFIITRRVCLSLQRKDREIALHGREAGIIQMSPSGGFSEKHERVSDYRLYELVAFESQKPVPAQPNKKGKIGGMEKMRAGLARLLFEERVEPVSRAELAEAEAHDHGHEEITDASSDTNSLER